MLVIRLVLCGCFVVFVGIALGVSILTTEQK
jgi:hypothetical protein